MQCRAIAPYARTQWHSRHLDCYVDLFLPDNVHGCIPWWPWPCTHIQPLYISDKLCNDFIDSFETFLRLSQEAVKRWFLYLKMVQAFGQCLSDGPLQEEMTDRKFVCQPVLTDLYMSSGWILIGCSCKQLASW